MSLSESEEIYLVKVIANKLIYLLNEWDEEITDSSLLITSGVLRQLLVDNNNYGDAWRTKIIGFEKEPTISAIDSDSYIFGIDKEIPPEKIEIFVVGGAKYKGNIIQSFGYKNYVEDIEKTFKAKEYLMKNPKIYTLNQYLNSTSLVIKGQKINKREVIKYITNKMGGVHIDFTRNENKFCDKKFKLLDKSCSLKLLNKDYIYYELLSIGQALANSEDTKKFINRAKDLKIV